MTEMEDSRLPARWVREACKGTPVQDVEGGSWISGPVRLMYPSLVNPFVSKMKRDDGSAVTPQYKTDVIFPPCADLSGLSAAIDELMLATYGKYRQVNAKTGNVSWAAGILMPLAEQSEKYGLTPGYCSEGQHAKVSSSFKPVVVDTEMQPIEDASEFYSGVWAVVAFRLYASNSANAAHKRGVKFDLQSVMKLEDDQALVSRPTARPEVLFASVKKPVPTVKPTKYSKPVEDDDLDLG